MRMRITRLTGALACLVATAALAGCGDSDSDAGDAADPGGEATSSTSTPTSESSESSDPGAPEPGGVPTFDVAVDPTSGVTDGDTVTATATGAEPDTAYYCVLSAVTEDGSLTASNVASLIVVTSDADGALTCEQPFAAFEAADENGDTRACPPTEADAEAGFRCAIALADQATTGAASAAVGFFDAAG